MFFAVHTPRSFKEFIECHFKINWLGNLLISRISILKQCIGIIWGIFSVQILPSKNESQVTSALQDSGPAPGPVNPACVFMIKIQMQLHQLLNNLDPAFVTDLSRDVNSINITLSYPQDYASTELMLQVKPGLVVCYLTKLK